MSQKSSQLSSGGEGIADRSIQAAERMESMAEAAGREAVAQMDHTVDRIRNINEQLIEAASASGNRVLDTYERTLSTMLEFQLSMANSTQLEWVNAIARAQAQFMLEVSSYYTKAARDLLG